MFSVIMPVWNRANLAQRAIASVLAQTCRDFELVVVDDGSDDGLEREIGPLLGEQVRYLRIAHQGVSAARNHGIRNSSNPEIAYLDSDNVWHPEYLARMKAALEEPPGTDCAYCRCRIYRRDRKGRIFSAEEWGAPFNFAALLDRNTIDLNTFVHRRSCLEHSGPHDESIKRLADWDFILRVTTAYPPRYVPEILVDYYLLCYDDSISLTQSARPAARRLRAKTRAYDGPVRVRHDAIEYSWHQLPDAKRHNWARMQTNAFDTTDFKAWGFPYLLQIEPTNVCNLACPLCPTGTRTLNRAARHLKLEEFTGLIDDVERYLLLAVLWDWGEPLMNPQLPAMIRYADERGIKTVTSTNGHFFRDEAYLAALLESGLSTLIVAVDSTSAEGYETYRKDGSLDVVRAGVERLVALRRKTGSRTRIVLRTVAMKQNEGEIGAIQEYARRSGADAFVVKTLNPGGLASPDSDLVPDNPRYHRFAYLDGTKERIRSSAPCKRIWKIANIYSNGDVVPCCYDFAGEMKLGNIFERPFTEIWNGQAYCDLRRRIFTERSSEPHCCQCADSYRHSDAGMFAQAWHFNRHPEETLVETVRNYLFSPQVLRVARRAARKLGIRNN